MYAARSLYVAHPELDGLLYVVVPRGACQSCKYVAALGIQDAACARGWVD
jgi:hypothetical protein